MTTSKIRIYDLAKELDRDTKRLIEEVRREVDLISTLMMQDSFKPFTNEDFANGARFMLEFAQSRPAFVREQVAAARLSRR